MWPRAPRAILASHASITSRLGRLPPLAFPLAGDLLEGGTDIQLTELGDEQLLKLVALDLAAAINEA